MVDVVSALGILRFGSVLSRWRFGVLVLASDVLDAPGVPASMTLATSPLFGVRAVLDDPNVLDASTLSTFSTYLTFSTFLTISTFTTFSTFLTFSTLLTF